MDTEGKLYLGWISEEEYDAETAAKLFEILNGDGIVFFEEETEWGTDYTGAMPVRDSSGKSIAVLAVDIDISFISSMIREYAWVNIGIIFAAGTVFIGLFLLWSRRNITKPIKKLEESAVGFADRSHGQRDLNALSFDAPEITTNNEIKSLSEAVVKMTDDMRDYVEDIISAESRADEMHELANRDKLTGIRNKTAYDEELRQLQTRLDKGDTSIGLAVVDLNYLKKTNDTYGHAKGNELIQKLSRLLCEIFAHSPVFRIGGDEFVVILQGRDFEYRNSLVDIFESELTKMAADASLEPWEKVSAAMGVAIYDAALDTDLDNLFKRADQQMYEKKKQMKAARKD